ncbi:hypothetical protein BAUCODRAFT_21244 [Baudoinia panamericana UAMH 10762]|uniref:Uncharacterized protein n=1 Tax=Baudoinia panamericana (strain UAMH 10762) TaxID=717646 RepID=M2NJX1_BAUPA|nr:uncharacterized protein BAUCODRAFT_21244 [Baudoinia panamericana UAMH 10762]EMC99435.1 hypothetical protein BAUCODRAFT_21244 [Baudoinia panamericana UAMH 10762]
MGVHPTLGGIPTPASSAQAPGTSLSFCMVHKHTADGKSDCDGTCRIRTDLIVEAGAFAAHDLPAVTAGVGYGVERHMWWWRWCTTRVSGIAGSFLPWLILIRSLMSLSTCLAWRKWFIMAAACLAMRTEAEPKDEASGAVEFALSVPLACCLRIVKHCDPFWQWQAVGVWSKQHRQSSDACTPYATRSPFEILSCGIRCPDGCKSAKPLASEHSDARLHLVLAEKDHPLTSQSVGLADVVGPGIAARSSNTKCACMPSNMPCLAQL